MIKLTSRIASGATEHYVASRAISQIREAGSSSQWHGIRAYVTLFDGQVIEVEETASEINKLIEKESTPI
jgi:hypothetical protein